MDVGRRRRVGRRQSCHSAAVESARTRIAAARRSLSAQSLARRDDDRRVLQPGRRERLIITREGIELVAAAYLGGAADNAFTSPVRADVAGLPPVLMAAKRCCSWTRLFSLAAGRCRASKSSCMSGRRCLTPAVPSIPSCRPCGDCRGGSMDAAPAWSGNSPARELSHAYGCVPINLAHSVCG